MRSLEDIFSEIATVPDFFEHRIDSVHYRNGYGDTPLHIVSCWGDCEAIKVLVAAGADIDAPGEHGFTPLHCAVEQDHPEAVALLLELGAKLNPDADGLTPAEIAGSLGKV
ncbi:ankyrin repeat domain-containing protein [Pseudomonas nitroreducens]|uniref:ankyrin repeat domain-containing protein n=1 Tax=Pseudomonas nitroreducens TaxID=46680 RepID=UPI0028B19CA4|nr:ankyrin repeat domain-containing protein [Pseudomonas nitroreducens]